MGQAAGSIRTSVRLENRTNTNVDIIETYVYSGEWTRPLPGRTEANRSVEGSFEKKFGSCGVVGALKIEIEGQIFHIGIDIPWEVLN